MTLKASRSEYRAYDRNVNGKAEEAADRMLERMFWFLYGAFTGKTSLSEARNSPVNKLIMERFKKKFRSELMRRR
jgi:hypothetical protein